MRHVCSQHLFALPLRKQSDYAGLDLLSVEIRHDHARFTLLSRETYEKDSVGAKAF